MFFFFDFCSVLIGFVWFCLVLFCLVLFGFAWFWLVFFGLGWFCLLLGFALFCSVLLGFARFCLLLGCPWCYLVSVGGERPSESSDQMMVVGVLVAFVMVVVVVVVIQLGVLSVEVVVAVVNLKHSFEVGTVSGISEISIFLASLEYPFLKIRKSGSQRPQNHFYTSGIALIYIKTFLRL